MYLLPKFLSKIIKNDGFILISPAGQKFIIGEPKKDKPLEVKISKKVSEIKCMLHSERWIPEHKHEESDNDVQPEDDKSTRDNSKNN